MRSPLTAIAVARGLIGSRVWKPPLNKSASAHIVSACHLVRPLGFEPRTNGLRVHCSAIELEARANRQCTGTNAPALPVHGVSEGT